MTRKEQMLAAIRGLATPRIPWAPRLDLWYRANRRAGTLPAKYAKATLAEMVDDLGWGYHAVIPDFRDLHGPLDDADRALGIYNLRAMPVRTVLENVERRGRVDGERTHIEYRTPKGTIRATTLYDESMKRAGITITHVEETAFKSAADYAALGRIFENARVEPNPDGYAEFASRIGDRGVAVGYTMMSGSPMHALLRDVIPFELFFYEMFDRPDQLRALADAVGGYFRRLMEAAAKSAAEAILFGANYDATTTNLRFFAEHITPWLRECADLLHARRKFLLTHTDGENTGLLDEYLKSGFDVADSICPKPMTKLTFKQVRDTFGGRIAIMGGIPSVTLLKSSMHDVEFGKFLDDFFADLGRGERLILGISDTTPPGAEFDRLVEIAKRVEEFGPVQT